MGLHNEQDSQMFEEISIMKIKKYNIIIFLFLYSILLAACISSSQSDAVEENFQNLLPTSTDYIKKQNEDPNMTGLDDKCPQIYNEDTILSSGSVIYNSDDIPGIWAISTLNQTPILVYDTSQRQPSSVMISKDSNQLLIVFEEYDPENGFKYEIVVYDLLNQEETLVNLETESWLTIWDWLDDGRIKFLKNVESLPNLGEIQEYVIVNPTTQSVEEVIKKFDLPSILEDDGIQFLYSKIASVSPDQKHVLYTGLGTNSKSEIVLWDVHSDSLIWKQQGDFAGVNYPPPPFLTSQPEWNENGDEVLFSGILYEEDESYRGVFQVTQDAQLEQLVNYNNIPSDDKQGWHSRYFSISPNNRYLHLGLAKPSDEPPRTIGPGFILNTVTSEVKEICDPNSVFIDGKWNSNDKFLYRVLKHDNSQSLRILDIPSWTTQILYETDPGNGINIIGWTPIEFP